MERSPECRIRVALARQVELGENEAIGGKTHVDALQPLHAAREKTRGRHDGHGQRHLPGHQQPSPAGARRTSRAPSSGAKAVDEVQPRGSQCWNRTRQRGREKGDTGCESHNGDVNPNGFRTWKAVGHERDDGLQAPARQHDAHNGSGESYHETLGEELCD